MIADNGKEADAPTAMLLLNDEDFEAGETLVWSADVVSGGGGGSGMPVFNAVREYRPPMFWLDGAMWGRLLKKNHYHLAIDSGNTGVTITADFDMYARRVEIDIAEVIFDQLDVESLLVAGLISN